MEASCVCSSDSYSVANTRPDAHQDLTLFNCHEVRKVLPHALGHWLEVVMRSCHVLVKLVFLKMLDLHVNSKIICNISLLGKSLEFLL